MSVLRQSVHMIRQRPSLWLLALLAVSSDVGAVFSYSPYSVMLPPTVIWLLLLTFLAEVGLLYALLQQAQGKDNSLVDSFMMSVVTIFKTLLIKAIILIAPALFAIVLFVFVPVLSLYSSLQILAAAVTIPLLALSQVWTLFSLSGLFVQEYSFGEAILHGWRIIWEHKRRIVQVALPFLAIDLFAIGLLWVGGAISYQSACQYTVTPEQAEYNKELYESGQRRNPPGPIEPGDYFRLNRVLNGLSAAMFKARGVELLSIPLYFVTSRLIGLLAAVAGMLLIPLRIGSWVLLYFQVAEPMPTYQNVIAEIQQERNVAVQRQANFPTHDQDG